MAIALLMILTVVISCGGFDTGTIKSDTFDSIETIRKQKQSELLVHFRELHSAATGAANDTNLLNYFEVLLGDASLGTMSRQRLELEIDRHFVAHYDKFYDVLLIDSNGFVFHSIRKESDYNTIIVSDTLPTGLSQRLTEASGSPLFVDFEYYRPSDEPAAFHIIPVTTRSSHHGWLVFQQSLNRINTILTNRRGLGRTGEVYLVNSSGLMLSESRFIKNPIILKKQINTEAIGTTGSGNRLIRDYRGVMVFSSFEEFELLGTSWHIIAEVDEDEVITVYYDRHVEELADPIVEYISSSAHQSEPYRRITGSAVRVDMNEFGFARAGERICTHGVATCTAVAISYPGKFSYLAHLVPSDDIYTDATTEWFLDQESSDLLGRLLQRIHRFDIYPHELDNLRCTIVATHDNSLMEVVDRLTDFGINISRIRIMYNADALYANVATEPDCASVTAEWIGHDGDIPVIESNFSVADLGTIVKEIVGYGQ